MDEPFTTNKLIPINFVAKLISLLTINKLYDEGNHITYFTARGMGRFSDDPNASAKASALLFDLTEKQLKDWGCKYHDLILGKPHADFFIDDKGIQCDDFFKDK